MMSVTSQVKEVVVAAKILSYLAWLSVFGFICIFTLTHELTWSIYIDPQQDEVPVETDMSKEMVEV